MTEPITMQIFRQRLNDIVRWIGMPHDEPEVVNWSSEKDFDSNYRALVSYFKSTANVDGHQPLAEPAASLFRKFEQDYVVRGFPDMVLLRVQNYRIGN